MAVYKDKHGKWYVSVYFVDWKGERARKLKRGFGTKREAQEWERQFLNQSIFSTDKEGKVHYINAIKLLYNCNYSLVVLDAESILAEYEATGQFSTGCLHCCDQRVDEAIGIELTEKEKKQAFVVRDGIIYFVIGNGQTYLHSVHFDEGWLPPQ